MSCTAQCLRFTLGYEGVRSHGKGGKFESGSFEDRAGRDEFDSTVSQLGMRVGHQRNLHEKSYDLLSSLPDVVIFYLKFSKWMK